MSRSDTRTSPKRFWLDTATVVVLAVAAAVLIPVILVAVAFSPKVWQGDVAAVVDQIDASGGYRVTYTERFPADAPDRDPTYDTASVSSVLEGVRLGDRVTCRVRQEYRPMSAYGTLTTVTRCWG
jgi:hypothetical protein